MIKIKEKKVCGVCKEEKSISEFWTRSDNGKARNTCKDCQTKQAQERADNKK